MWSTINTEGVDDWSEEVFQSVTGKNKHCPFGGAECKTVILTLEGLLTQHTPTLCNSTKTVV